MTPKEYVEKLTGLPISDIEVEHTRRILNLGSESFRAGLELNSWEEYPALGVVAEQVQTVMDELGIEGIDKLANLMGLVTGSMVLSYIWGSRDNAHNTIL